MRALNVTLSDLLDPRKSVAPLYRLDELPMSVLIDRAGVVRFVHYGLPGGQSSSPISLNSGQLLDE